MPKYAYFPFAGVQEPALETIRDDGNRAVTGNQLAKVQIATGAGTSGDTLSGYVAATAVMESRLWCGREGVIHKRKLALCGLLLLQRADNPRPSASESVSARR